ncbi:MAG: hypothetical protein ACREC1_02775 [Methylovirgula sp.]
MTARSATPLAAVVTALSISCAPFGTAALAQSAGQVASDAPVNDQANSAAAMKDTLQDPRIANAQGGERGIWKWVVPPVKMKGAFDNNDPIGVIAGKKIPADCSINWADPDTHRLFCFSTATSLVYFLDAPKDYTEKAEKAWHQMQKTPTG